MTSIVVSSSCDEGSNDEALVVLLHGGGYSGLTWGPMAKTLKDSVRCRIWALDLRGHGDTVFADEDEEKVLEAERMAEDISAVISHLVASQGGLTGPVVIVGHSMGGALAVHTGTWRVIHSSASHRISISLKTSQ